MNASYAIAVGQNIQVAPDEKVASSIFKEYERVIVESIVTSFGLDFIIKDQHGGDVDTIHNVRQVGVDSQMTYKNKGNEKAYENRGAYQPTKVDKNGAPILNKQGKKQTIDRYRTDPAYQQKGARDKKAHQEGNLHDVYRKQTMKRNENRQLDHTIAANEIHEDRARVLAEMCGVELANAETNLNSTAQQINNLKRAHTTEKFVNEILPAKVNSLKSTIAKNKEKLASMPTSTPEEQHKKQELTSKIAKQEKDLGVLESVDKKEMLKADKKARAAYEAKLAQKYYTSSKFVKDTAIAAGSVGLKMGARQALGFVFTEIWFAVKEEFTKVTGDFDFKSFLLVIQNGIMRGYENAKKKYKELFSKFLSGAVGGALSSLTTTLANIFFTTAKNVVKILRQTYASIIEALKILFLNPQGLPFGEVMRATAKVLATGASIVVGTMLSEAIAKTPIGQIPVAGDIVTAFVGSFVTGIMTCSLLYYLDKSETVAKLVAYLNTINTIDTEVQYFREQAAFFERYAAELEGIDYAQFAKEVHMYENITSTLESTQSAQEMSMALKNIYETVGICIPWEGDFNTFMTDKKTVLVFG